MDTFRRSQLSDQVLLQSCREHVSRERRATAELLADLAEVDARRLYAPAGYSSLYAWCVGELGLSEDATCARTRAARAGREFPAVRVAIAEGRLHLTGACLIAPHLTAENAEALIVAATRRSKAQIEEMLAARFPRPDVPTLLAPVTVSDSGNVSVPERMIFTEPEQRDAAPAPEPTVAPPPALHTRVAPLSPGRYELRGTLDADAHADLRVAQELLGVHAGDAMAVVARALKLLRRDLERRRCAATDRPRRLRRIANARTIPAAVRREVRQRDGGQCTFVGHSGHRCEERRALEFDHIVTRARGGESTPPNLRLRCRAHNHLEAERAYGRAFMERKRERARELRKAASAAAPPAPSSAKSGAGEPRVPPRTPDPGNTQARDLLGALQTLGYSATLARQAADATAEPATDSLETRLRAALAWLSPARLRRVSSAA